MPNRDDPVIIIDQGIQDRLNQLGRRLSNLEPLMAEIGEIGVLSIQENFQQEGRPRKWAPLAESTKEQRRRQGRARGRILNRLGAAGLFGSINYRADRNSVAIGTNRIYGPTMHYGARKGEFGTITANIRAHVRRVGGKNVRVRAHTRRMPVPWGDIPSRPFLMFQDEDWQDIGEAIDEYLIIQEDQ